MKTLKKILTIVEILLIIAVIAFVIFRIEEYKEKDFDTAIRRNAEEIYENHILDSDEQSSLTEKQEKQFEILDESLKATYNTQSTIYENEGYFAAGNSVTYAVYNHAKYLFNNGCIHGTDIGYWCTFFAQMWFYDVYSFNSSGDNPSGDGFEFATTVYQTHTYYDKEGNLCHYFSLDDKPKAMGLVSTKYTYNESGHVLCVDEVDYTNNTITISDGNYDGEGGIRMHVTMSLEQFYSEMGYQTVFVNPTLELIEKIFETKE